MFKKIKAPYLEIILLDTTKYSAIGCEFFIRYRVHFAGSRKNTKADAAPLPPEGGQAQERTEQMPQTAPLPEDGAKETN